MPTVLITPMALIGVEGPWTKNLREAGFEIRYPEDRTFTRGLCGDAETIRVLSVADAVLAGGECLTPPVLAASPKLRVVARAGVGYDRVDIPAATAKKIAVTITPTANHESVAESVFALLFAVAKSVVVSDRKMRQGEWFPLTTRPIRKTTLGVFGLGRIGRSTAIRGRGMGMRVLATEVAPDQEFVKRHGIEIVDFDTLLASSDYLSINCPLSAQTSGLFNRDVFSRMKKGSILINTARGGIVVERDLVDALRSGHLVGAGLDVFEQEPTAPDNPLFQFDNVVVMPHLAGSDTLSQEDMAIEAASCIIKLNRGEWPTGCVVNDQLREGWKW